MATAVQTLTGLFVGAGLTLAAGGIWAIGLIIAGGTGRQTLGYSILLLAMVGALGMILSRGRWSLRLSLIVLALTAVLPLVSRDGWWAIGSITAVLAFGVLSTKWGQTGLRKLPPAEPVPDQGVILPLYLLGVPGVVAVLQLDDAGWTLTAWAVGVWLLAATYSRASQPALWFIRLALLPVTVIVGFSFGWIPGIAAVGAIALATGLAWHPQALVAVTDAAPRLVAPVSVPPELVPEDLMNAAGYDSSGRRLPIASDQNGQDSGDSAEGGNEGGNTDD